MSWAAAPATLTIVRWATVVLLCANVGVVMVWADYSARLRCARHRVKLLTADIVKIEAGS